MSEVKPIKPTEILNKKIATIPSVIIQIVNELLVKNWDGHSSVIRMDELFDKYFKRTGLPDDRANRDTVHDNNWLHFESAYRNEGLPPGSGRCAVPP